MSRYLLASSRDVSRKATTVPALGVRKWQVDPYASDPDVTAIGGTSLVAGQACREQKGVMRYADDPMANQPWTRDQRIGVAGIALAIFFGLASVTMPEVRRYLKLESEPVAHTGGKPLLDEAMTTSSHPGDEPQRAKIFGTARNVIIFNACKADSAHTELAEILGVMYPGTRFDFQYNWTGRSPLQRTRIYYMQAEHSFDASQIARALPGTQDVINYIKQQAASKSLPDEPREIRIVGMQPHRNLAIFLGADYPDILLHVRRTAHDRRQLF